MQKVFNNPSELERLAKEKYAIPQFLMMENAAKALADFILDFTPEQVVILCGKGNNGGDGYAVARLLQNKCDVCCVCIEPPAAEEAKAQYEMARRLGIPFVDTLPHTSIIVDCIYGTGFRGTLPENVKQLLDEANKSKAIRIACDIPSGLAFNADYTITMGEQKLALYSDKAKAICGKIIVAELGIAPEKLLVECDEVVYRNQHVYVVEPTDITLPLRKNRAAHKGTYGHTAVFCGEKCGAAILTATAAMNFGSGLTSLIEGGNLNQFKISPSLMLATSIPKKTTCIAAGPGFTEFSAPIAEQILEWFGTQKTPAAVFDAGFITAPQFPDFLKKLNSTSDARIILTPHLSELSRFLSNTGKEISVSDLAEDPECKVQAGNFLTSLYPNTTVIMKSANSFIASGDETYIIANGSQSLAKGGSGDILAGLAASLLAQGYSAKDAAITAAFHHAQTAAELGSDSYSLTPELLLSKI